MSTQEEEVRNNSEENSEESSEEQNLETSTNNQQNSRIKTQVETELEAQLENQKKYLAQLEQQIAVKDRAIERFNEKRETETVTPSKEIEATEYYSDPVRHTRDVVRAELAEQLAELKELARTMRGGNELDRVVNVLRSHPTLGQHLDDNAVGYLREAFGSGAAEPTEANVRTALLQIIGARAAGVLEAPKSPTTEKKEMIPAHIPPSNPARPNAPQAKKSRPLTELEKRVMREQGFTTVEEFLYWMNEKADAIATSNYGQAKP
jgi:hypothetical protein